MRTEIEPKRDAPVSRDEPPRALIVDDDPVVRMLLQDICEQYGWSVAVAETRDDALLAAGLRSPHLALVDFNLGDGNATDLLRDLRTVCPTTPLFVITGELPERIGVAVARAGGSGVVAKPCSVADVAALLTRHRPASPGSREVRR